MPQPAADTCLCFLTVVLRDLQVFNQCQPDPEVKLGVGQQMCWSKLSCLNQSNLVAVTLVAIDADVITIARTSCSKAALAKKKKKKKPHDLNVLQPECVPSCVWPPFVDGL